MSDRSLKSYKRFTNLQILVCGFLFAIFSFTYLYIFQSDLLEALHYALSHGRTHYVALPSAIIITIVLLLLRWGINSLLGLKGGIRALAYFPSFIALGALTDIGRYVYLDNYESRWVWLLPVTVLIFIILGMIFSKVLRRQLNEYIAPLPLFVWNVLIILVFSLMTLRIGNTERIFHLELKTEQLIRNHKYKEALQVGHSVRVTSHTLTALRAYAMEKEGTIGERLFDFPQLYGSQGLFFSTDTTKTLRMRNDSIYYMLGARPTIGKQPDVEFLSNICHKSIAKHSALSYYMSGLLLDKHLKRFVNEIKTFYFVEDTLPKYFRQALILYNTKHPTTAIAVNGAAEEQELFRAYMEKKAETQQSPYQKEQLRENFENTYWWYYDFQ